MSSFLPALSPTEESTIDRKFGNLARVPDNYENTVVTLRESAHNTNNDIRLISLREFQIS